MKDKDKISKSYRERIDEFLDNRSGAGLPDTLNQAELEGIWEEISSELDIDEVWNGVISELDIDEVWTGISSDLDKTMPRDSDYSIIFRSIAAVFIILIGMIPVIKKAERIPVIPQQNISVGARQIEQPEILISENKQRDSSPGEHEKGDISTVISGYSDKSDDDKKAIYEEKDETVQTEELQIPVSDEVISEVFIVPETADSNLVVRPDVTPVEYSGISPATVPVDLEKVKLFSNTEFHGLKLPTNPSTAGSSIPFITGGKISGGLTTVYKNTWLLNYETFDGLRPESLITTKIALFPDVGISLNYSFNKSWLLQADAFLYSNTGQKYYKYIYGHYSKRTITLRYSTIALSVKYKFAGRWLFMHNSSINLLAGGYVSVLNRADQKINADLKNIVSQYGKFDIGVRLGSEIELDLFDKLSIAPGLFMSLGIPNIYKGDSNIPGYLGSTHNGSAGFHLTFYYHGD